MERVEEDARRQEILRVREANKRTAQLITLGTAKHEPVHVLGIDGQLHDFEVFALSDGALLDLLSTTGVDLKDIGDREKLANNLKFLQKGAALATGVPEIANALMPMESLKLIMKSFELSGLTGVPKAA